MSFPRRVVKPWQQSYPAAFAAHTHDRVELSSVSVSGKEGEWPGWIWMLDEHQVSGWVPEDFTTQDSTGYYMRRDFNAIELSVHPGEEVTVSEEVAGWAWCINAEGTSGWVPSDCLSTTLT